MKINQLAITERLSRACVDYRKGFLGSIVYQIKSASHYLENNNAALDNGRMYYLGAREACMQKYWIVY